MSGEGFQEQTFKRESVIPSFRCARHGLHFTADDICKSLTIPFIVTYNDAFVFERVSNTALQFEVLGFFSTGQARKMGLYKTAPQQIKPRTSNKRTFTENPHQQHKSVPKNITALYQL